MDEQSNRSLDTLIQEKLDTDVDFQESLVDMPEEDQVVAIETKRKEILEAEFKKRDELANNYKVRAEKAEKAAKAAKPGADATPKPASDDLSTKDLYALMNAKVPEEDVDEVVKAAKVLGKSIPDALRDNVVQSILRTNAEYRKTAQATNVGTARPSTKKVSPEEILQQAASGNVPQKGTTEAEELFWARRGGRR